MTLSSSVLCTHKIDEVFKCSVTDVKIEDGKLPTNISFSDLRNSKVGKSYFFVVNGTFVKHFSTLMPTATRNSFFNAINKSIEFGEYSIPNARCKKRWKKQGRLGMLMECFEPFLIY